MVALGFLGCYGVTPTPAGLERNPTVGWVHSHCIWAWWLQHLGCSLADVEQMLVLPSPHTWLSTGHCPAVTLC